jgi:dTDP-glucose 4,6-dehydratase
VPLRIIVAGAAGFIGSHLCERLVDDGHEVIGLDNLITGSLKNLEGLRSNPLFQFHTVDIVRGVPVEGPADLVMNLASPASPKDYLNHPIATLEAGSIGSQNLLELARAKQARYLLASTSECYGDPLEHPQVETYWGNVNPVGPRSCYDESKRFAEAMAMAYHRSYGMPTRIARIFNTYGPRMKLDDGRVAPSLISQALRGKPLTVFGDGSQTRSFCYVSDLVEGLIRLSGSEEPYPVNLGNPEEMTILQFAEAVKRITGTTAPIEFRELPEDDPKVRRPDISKARRILGWEPRVEFEDGIRLAIADFQRALETPVGSS